MTATTSANLSLQIPKPLLDRLKRIACKRMTSTSAVVREILSEHVATKKAG